MTLEEALNTCAFDVSKKLQQGAGCAVKTVKGKGGLVEGVIVGIRLNPALSTEFVQMVHAWAQSKRLAKGAVIFQ